MLSHQKLCHQSTIRRSLLRIEENIRRSLKKAGGFSARLQKAMEEAEKQQKSKARALNNRYTDQALSTFALWEKQGCQLVFLVVLTPVWLRIF